MGVVGVVINPRSRRSSAALRARALRALEGDHEVLSLVTRRRGDGEELARAAREAGCETVVTLGGDGTVNEVALALEDSGVALCPMPLGGTNVFARALGWPAAPGEALGLLARTVAGRERLTRSVRLWRVEAGGVARRICLNAGVGIDADVVERVERRPRVKRALGQGAFAAAAVRGAHRAARRGASLRVASDDGEPFDAVSISMALGGPYAYLRSRPLDLVPGATFDGALHWVSLTGTRRTDVLRVAAGAFAGGRHASSEAVTAGLARDGLTVRAASPVGLQVDGEPLGEHVEIRLTPAGILTVLPPIDSRAKPAGSIGT